MKYSSYMIRWARLAGEKVRSVRWRDPLVQSWGLIGGLLVAGLVAHLAAGPETGEQKNAKPWAELLTSEPVADGWCPSVVMSAEAVATPEQDAELDLRALAQAAAAREDWRYAGPELRAALRALPVEVPGVTVTWSYTPGGDARAFAHYAGRQGAGEPAYEYVIGNGRRSRDGEIEVLPRHAAGDGHGVRVCLTGRPGTATEAQKAALGELITCLEARCGTLPLAMHRPAAAGVQGLAVKVEASPQIALISEDTN
jgi:hypothetical protein